MLNLFKDVIDAIFGSTPEVETACNCNHDVRPIGNGEYETTQGGIIFTPEEPSQPTASSSVDDFMTGDDSLD